MGVPLTLPGSVRRLLPGITLAMALSFAVVPSRAAEGGADVTLDIAVKAGFLFNFAKFTEWPALPPGAPIMFCLVGSDAVATALNETVRGQSISGHALDVSWPQDGAAWKTCQLLFVPDTEIRRSFGSLVALKTLPVLTISDSKSFSQTGGIIELYVESGRMRFAINVDAVERSGLRLSSRLLGLANIVRDSRGLQ
jgi:hypothetical protein